MVDGVNPEDNELIPKYEDVVEEFPERDIKIDDVEVAPSESESEDDEGVHKTDLQTAMAAITPKFRNKRMNEILQPVMSSRVMPDNYLDLNYLLTMMQIEEGEGKLNSKGVEDIDILAIITGNQAATSIAYEGRHIADILEIAGVAQESEMENLAKGLGM